MIFKKRMTEMSPKKPLMSRVEEMATAPQPPVLERQATLDVRLGESVIQAGIRHFGVSGLFAYSGPGASGGSSTGASSSGGTEQHQEEEGSMGPPAASHKAKGAPPRRGSSSSG